MSLISVPKRRFDCFGPMGICCCRNGLSESMVLVMVPAGVGDGRMWCLCVTIGSLATMRFQMDLPNRSLESIVLVFLFELMIGTNCFCLSVEMNLSTMVSVHVGNGFVIGVGNGVDSVLSCEWIVVTDGALLFLWSCSSLAMVPCGCRRFVSVKMSVCVSFCCRLSGSHRYRSYVLSLVRRIYVRNRLTKSCRCRFVSVSLVDDADVQLVRKRVACFVEGRGIACLLYRGSCQCRSISLLSVSVRVSVGAVSVSVSLVGERWGYVVVVIRYRNQLLELFCWLLSESVAGFSCRDQLKGLTLVCIVDGVSSLWQWCSLL